MGEFGRRRLLASGAAAVLTLALLPACATAQQAQSGAGSGASSASPSAAGAGAGAATFPTRPIRILVPFTAGSGSDVYARFFGKKLSEIAEEMTLSPKTVSVYRARALEKLKLSTNADITMYAIRNNLV